MNIGIIIYSEDAETVWNAFRFGNFALKKGDNTKVFLMGMSTMEDLYRIVKESDKIVTF